MKIFKIMIAALLMLAAQSAHATSGAVVVGDGYAPYGGGVAVGFGVPYGSYCYNYPYSAGCGYYGYAGPVYSGFYGGYYGGGYNGRGRGYYRGGYRGGHGGGARVGHISGGRGGRR